MLFDAVKRLAELEVALMELGFLVHGDLVLGEQVSLSLEERRKTLDGAVGSQEEPQEFRDFLKQFFHIIATAQAAMRKELGINDAE